MSSRGDHGTYEPFPSFAAWASCAYDPSDFDMYVALFAATREGAKPEAIEAALSAATREAAVDTNAIEGIYSTDRGFTRTIATQAAAWESVLDARPPIVRAAFTDAMNGYEHVLDCATQRAPISEIWIRRLHEILCASQTTYRVQTQLGPEDRPFVKGVYKTLPNSPTLVDGRVHAYASPLDTGPEMNRLIQELRSEAFLTAHPVLQAAYAHYAYVAIHPFPDGNGRVARALASVFLYRDPGVPLVIFADQRNDYFDALEAADNSNPVPFIQFVGDRAVDTMGIMRLRFSTAPLAIDASLSKLRNVFSGVGGADAEARAAVTRLKRLAHAAFLTRMKDVDVPPQVSLESRAGHVGDFPPPEGYMSIGEDAWLYAVARISWPVAVFCVMPMGVFYRGSPSATSDFLVSTPDGASLNVSGSDIVPTETEALKAKLTAWADVAVAEFIAKVSDAADAARSV